MAGDLNNHPIFINIFGLTIVAGRWIIQTLWDEKRGMKLSANELLLLHSSWLSLNHHVICRSTEYDPCPRRRPCSSYYIFSSTPSNRISSENNHPAHANPRIETKLRFKHVTKDKFHRISLCGGVKYWQVTVERVYECLLTELNIKESYCLNFRSFWVEKGDWGRHLLIIHLLI